MWASKYEKGHYHAPHTHANNVLSGAYYLTNGTPVQFFDPRPEVLSPTCTENTIDNVSAYNFNAVKGTGVIFPLGYIIGCLQLLILELVYHGI